ncbi:MAG: response regulator [Campylobacterales bacterium]|nr:response regulator [Campylobacterales bacterium]
MSRVLIVEDERIPANYLKKVLLKEGYEVVSTVASGEAAIEHAGAHRPDIILMDIMLEGALSGTEAARTIRRFMPDVIIIFLTAYSETQMLDMALESRAYAYLVKPYRDKEIITTLRLAMLGSAKAPLAQPATLQLVGGYRFERESERLFLDSKEVPLGPVALRLLALLSRSPQSSVSIEQIMEHVWGESVSQQTLRSLIHRIRDQTHKELIVNVNKVGYRLSVT